MDTDYYICVCMPVTKPKLTECMGETNSQTEYVDLRKIEEARECLICKKISKKLIWVLDQKDKST
jgi:hypothetical protein